MWSSALEGSEGLGGGLGGLGEGSRAWEGFWRGLGGFGRSLGRSASLACPTTLARSVEMWEAEQLCGSGCSVWKGLGDLEQVWLLWDHAGAVELWGSEQMSGSGCSGTIQALTSALEAFEGSLGRHRLA